MFRKVFALLVLNSLACLVLSPARAEDKSDGYPRAKLLLEPAALARPQTARQFIVLDARSRAAFEEEHVPGARWIDHDAWNKAFGDGDDAATWSSRIGELGIGPKSKVVLYDDARSSRAARMWWILRYWGVKDARLLNGGWKAWKAEELPTGAGAPEVEAVEFAAQAQAERLAKKADVLAMLEQGTGQIIDARSEGEFCGVEKQENQRGGAIPGARWLEWSDLIDPETQRFKSAAELRRLFAEAGIDIERPATAHCQSGGRASVMAFALELMGAPPTRNYYRSWAEWGNDPDTPIVTPEQGSRVAPRES